MYSDSFILASFILAIRPTVARNATKIRVLSWQTFGDLSSTMLNVNSIRMMLERAMFEIALFQLGGKFPRRAE